ncbi:MAG: D-alanine--D-alanine ligase [Pirellulales bacterium]|nr:D-alanine--D-alanine ligase [Pirellulales bacterium]
MSVRSHSPGRPWRVAVLRGGPSAEREVSLAGGRAVAAAVRSLGHLVTEGDIGPDDLSALDVPADIIFPVLHGRFGEDGHLQKILEERGLAFVGSGSEASRISIDKDASKRKWRAAGLPTAPWVIAGSDSDPALGHLDPPLVVKPLAEGSSIGVTLCDTAAELKAAVRQAVSSFGRAMVEKRLDGPELTVGILGHDPLPVIQVRPAAGWYDYSAKYERNDTDYLVDPAIDGTTCQAVQQLAVKAFEVLGCRHLSRVDFIVDRQTGPQLLEINTLPGFTDHSLLPKAAAHTGIPFPRLVEMLLEMAWASSGG